MRIYTDAERWQAFLRHTHSQPTFKAVAFAPPGILFTDVAQTMNGWADELCEKYRLLDECFANRSSDGDNKKQENA